MEPIFFTKLTTTGTSYIILNYLERPVPKLDHAHLAKQMTHVESGVGADGLILLLPSNQADYKAIFYNKDGSLAKICANGLRLIGYHLLEIGRFTQQKLMIETSANIVSLSHEGSMITVDLGTAYPLNLPTLPLSLNSPIKDYCEEVSVTSDTWEADMISMGNPHFIIYTDDDHDRFHKEMKYLSSQNDVNVGMITIIHPSEILLTTYERGGGLTNACGTNAAAAIASAVSRRLIKPYEWITVHCKGADLEVKWTDDAHLIQKGECSKLCCGTYFYTG